MLPTNELAAILTLSDYFFARAGIANEDVLNPEQMIIANSRLGILEEQWLNGSVIPLHDVIQDAYDRVIHCVDRHTEESTALPSPAACRAAAEQPATTSVAAASQTVLAS